MYIYMHMHTCIFVDAKASIAQKTCFSYRKFINYSYGPSPVMSQLHPHYNRQYPHFFNLPTLLKKYGPLPVQGEV